MPTICRGLKPATANYSFQSHPITDGSNIHPLTWKVIFFLLNDAVENCTLSKDREQQKLSKRVPGDIISLERYKDTPSRLRETWCWMYHVCVCVCVCVKGVGARSSLSIGQRPKVEGERMSLSLVGVVQGSVPG